MELVTWSLYFFSAIFIVYIASNVIRGAADVFKTNE